MTPDNTNASRYRWRLWILLVTAICTFAAVNLQSKVKFKVPFNNQSDLGPHIISDLPKDISAPVIIVGSSESSGLNGHLNSRLQVRNVYDLSTGNGNILTSMAFAALARPYHPKVIILGWAENALMDMDLLWSNVVTSQPDLLRNYVPEDLFKEIHAANSFPIRFFNTVSSWLTPLGAFSVNAAGVMSNFRDRLFQKRIEGKSPTQADPYFTSAAAQSYVSLRRFKIDLIRGFKKLAKDEGAQLIIYIVPTRTEKVSYDDSMENLKRFKAEDIEVHDYFELYADKPSLFRDPAHLGRKGLELFSEHIYNDLVASNCASEIAAFCSAGKSDLENCLWENADKLGPSCRWLRPPLCKADKERYCNDIPDDQLGQCFREHYSQLTRACRKIQDPCDADLSLVSQGTAPNDRDNYLWEHYQSISPECREFKKRYYQIDPCRVDVRRYCKSTSNSEIDNCLRTHFNDLTPECRERRDPCDADLSTVPRKMNADERSIYLWAHYQTLTPGCKARYEPYYRTSPCAVDQAKFCGSLTSDRLDECLTKHYAELAPECQSRRNPCDLDAASLCTDMNPDKREVCLWSHYQTLTPNCKARYEPFYRSNPCAVDQAKFCGSLSSDHYEECLTKHYTELTPECQSRRNPCDADSATFCTNVTPDNRENCLWAHYSTLSSSCRTLLQPYYRLNPCKVDYEKFCNPPLHRDYDDCLKSHYANLSAECRELHGPL